MNYEDAVRSFEANRSDPGADAFVDTFKIDFNIHTAAFRNYGTDGDEVARILRKIADRVAGTDLQNSEYVEIILDRNGQRIGGAFTE